MTVVGRTGHMTEQVVEHDDDGNVIRVVKESEFVQDTVTVRVAEPGGWQVDANDETEEKARDLGRKVIEQAKAEMRKQVAQQVAAGALSPQQAEQVRKDAKL